MAKTEHLLLERDGWIKWLTPGYGYPTTRIRFAPGPGGRLVAAELRLEYETGLNATQLRKIPLARIERWLNKPDVRQAFEEQSHGLPAWPRVSPRVPVPDRQGRKPYPASFYRRVAKVASAGHSATAIAEASGVPASTVNRWIKGARERRLLPESKRKSK